MWNLTPLMMSAALTLTAVAPTAAYASLESRASDLGLGRTDTYIEQAFTLEEMNCFSSDIHARDQGAADASAPGDVLDMRLASGSSGTNGIPCDPKDPKAPPKKKRTRS